MRINLPKTLDQLIFSKCSQNQLNISKFLLSQRRRTLQLLIETKLEQFFLKVMVQTKSVQNAAMCPSAQCPCLAIREVVSWDIIKDCHCHHVVIIKCHRSNIKLEHFVIVHIMIHS